MKKINLIFWSLFLVIILAGCGSNGKEVKDQKVDLNLKTEEPVSQDNNNETTTENVDKEEGMIGKLKNSILSGKKMKCVYKINDENANTEVITYVQGDKYKTEVNLGQVKTISIFDGDAMYSWSTDQKIGTKMTMDCIDSLDTKNEATTDENEEIPAVEDEEGFVEALKDAQNLNCDETGDIDFSIPDDINFTDQCEMLKSQQEMLKSLNK